MCSVQMRKMSRVSAPKNKHSLDHRTAEQVRTGVLSRVTPSRESGL